MTIQELREEHQSFGIPNNIIRKIFDAINTLDKNKISMARIELEYGDIDTITLIWSSSYDSISIESSIESSRILFYFSSKFGCKNGYDTDLNNIKSYLEQLYQSKTS